jgi:hypothetical protein
LDIEVQIVAKLPDKEYGDNEFSYREIYFMRVPPLSTDSVTPSLGTSMEPFIWDVEPPFATTALTQAQVKASETLDIFRPHIPTI